MHIEICDEKDEELISIWNNDLMLYFILNTCQLIKKLTHRMFTYVVGSSVPGINNFTVFFISMHD